MTEIPKGPLPDSMNRLQPVALRLLSCLLLMVGAHAGAASLQISPVMISLRAGQGATGITMQNMGEAPVYWQVSVSLWEQKNGDDVLTPTHGNARDHLSRHALRDQMSERFPADENQIGDAAPQTYDELRRVYLGEK